MSYLQKTVSWRRRTAPGQQGFNFITRHTLQQTGEIPIFRKGSLHAHLQSSDSSRFNSSLLIRFRSLCTNGKDFR